MVNVKIVKKERGIKINMEGQPIDSRHDIMCVEGEKKREGEKKVGSREESWKARRKAEKEEKD